VVSELIESAKDELSGEPSPARAIKLFDTATELGWTENPACSFVIRLTREDALPFYARWDLKVNPETGKRSWGFNGAMAQNGQKLAYRDIQTYLEDPDVIYPEPPTSPEDDTDESFRTALGSLDPLGPTAVPPGANANKPEPGFADWGALLS
jgi:hypothetical protein